MARNKRANRIKQQSHTAAELPRSRNAFAELSPICPGEEELNASLPERFARASLGRSASHPTASDTIPSAPASNNEIREYYELLHRPVTGGAWLTRPEIPNSADILRTEAAEFTDADPTLIEVESGLRPHKVEGPYQDKDEYLGTKYELLREDALRPFREAVAEVRASPFKDEAEYENKSLGVYDPVYITGLVFSNRGLATRVAFSLARVKKHIRWDQSKRLITGSLVALSPTEDAFQSICILATIAARPVSALTQNPPEIDLFFPSADQIIDPMKKYIMVESRATFFEASRHTLLALQHMMRESFPMSEYLVKVQKNVEPPAYIKDNPWMSLSSLASDVDRNNFTDVNVLQDWPAASSLSLDRSQNEALHRMLTRKLAIIQGPPGTGKTYVSVQAVKLLLENLHKFDAPIIITAQTNHAVDQMMRHVMAFEPNVVRLGGRSKDKEVKTRTLYEVRLITPGQKKSCHQKVRAITMLKKLTIEFQTLLLPFEANKPPLDHRMLQECGLITAEQAESLEIDSQCTMGASPEERPGILMEQWLGKSLAKCERPSQPDDYGWGFEEEDMEVEQLQDLEAEAVAQDDDDFETLRGPTVLLRENFVGKGSYLNRDQVIELLQTHPDLTAIPPQSRGSIYNYFKRELKKQVVLMVREIANEYSNAILQRKVGVWEEDSRILREARVIGCTTTGLSKYRALLSSLHPRVIIVEEAAETLEAPVTAACMPSLEHLILVGDHLQLRPHTQAHVFEDKPYFFNLSLFERLTMNEVAFSTLTRQRRMKPEIRRLLYYIYGNVLKDHVSVTEPTNRPPVEGMGGIDSFFFCHQWPENRDANMSCYNEKEAKMIVGFVDYLVLNGVGSEQITLLTFYNGQRKCLLRKLREHQNARSFALVKVVTVDGYQGEENEIVILSLVRSNTGHTIGFLSNDNRICVALSRAKRGFYIFGNALLMACESGVWASVAEMMFGIGKSKVQVDGRRIGYFFPLQCSNHGRKTWIEDAGDWDCIHGGCDIRCDGKLPCEHPCLYRCHPFPHDFINCMQECNRVLPCKHKCTAICSDPCRCQICERRSNGVKPLLKQGPHDGSPKQRSSRASRPVSSPALREHNVATNQWTSYANGGAAADDARLYAKREEDEKRYAEIVRGKAVATASSSRSARLVELPEDKVEAKSAELLIDLSDGVEDVQTASPSNASTIQGKGKGKARMVENLLD